MKHTCHWDGCNKTCPPKMWGCKDHWFTLPKFLRDRVWASYVPGQEITKTPSFKYLAIAMLVQEWIKEFNNGNILTEKGFIEHINAMAPKEEDTK